jgi:FdhD protein
MHSPSDSVRRVPVRRVTRSGRIAAEDLVAVEEPLEVRLHGSPFAVIMRTPGADRELAAGFLLGEGVIASPDDLGAVEHCRHPSQPDRHNVVDVFLTAAARAGVERHLAERRNVSTTSSCGLCGRVTIESLERRLVPLAVEWAVAAADVARLPEWLRARQRLFDETGGLHAAGLFHAGGECLAFAEDVGRHNAVDKVVGRMLMDDRLPAGTAVLAVSGRSSYEIVQKAWSAGVPVACAVSAPSSLAIDLAQAAGITLIGFARDGRFTVYAHASRIVTDV